jgi:hypothetical protein
MRQEYSTKWGRRQEALRGKGLIVPGKTKADEAIREVDEV